MRLLTGLVAVTAVTAQNNTTTAASDNATTASATTASATTASGNTTATTPASGNGTTAPLTTGAGNVTSGSTAAGNVTVAASTAAASTAAASTAAASPSTASPSTASPSTASPSTEAAETKTETTKTSTTTATTSEMDGLTLKKGKGEWSFQSYTDEACTTKGTRVAEGTIGTGACYEEFPMYEEGYVLQEDDTQAVSFKAVGCAYDKDNTAAGMYVTYWQAKKCDAEDVEGAEHFISFDECQGDSTAAPSGTTVAPSGATAAPSETTSAPSSRLRRLDEHGQTSWEKWTCSGVEADKAVIPIEFNLELSVPAGATDDQKKAVATVGATVMAETGCLAVVPESAKTECGAALMSKGGYESLFVESMEAEGALAGHLTMPGAESRRRLTGATGEVKVELGVIAKAADVADMKTTIQTAVAGDAFSASKVAAEVATKIAEDDTIKNLNITATFAAPVVKDAEEFNAAVDLPANIDQSDMDDDLTAPDAGSSSTTTTSSAASLMAGVSVSSLLLLAF